MPLHFDTITILRLVVINFHVQNFKTNVSGLFANIPRHLSPIIQNIQQKISFNANDWLSTSGLIFFSGILFLWILRIFNINRISRRGEVPLLAIQALSAVFTPVSAAWPLSFASFFQYTKVAGPAYVEVDVVALIHHICNGDIELRDSNDLHYLFRERLQVYGWSIKTYLPFQWWIKNSIWTFEQRFNLSSMHPISANSESGSHPEMSMTSYNVPCIDLDLVPYFHLQQEIRRIQLVLRPKSSTVIEFSCLQAEVGFLTLQYMVCSIPFLPFLVHNKEGQRSNRKSTPLFTKVQDIVASFSAGHIIIEGIVNISYEHADALVQKERNLVHNGNLRRAHIKQVGLVGWREDRLMMLWEAGLLRSGYLNRWRMIIRK